MFEYAAKVQGMSFTSQCDFVVGEVIVCPTGHKTNGHTTNKKLFGLSNTI